MYIGCINLNFSLMFSFHNSGRLHILCVMLILFVQCKQHLASCYFCKRFLLYFGQEKVVTWACFVFWCDLHKFARETCLLVRQLAWGSLQRKRNGQGAHLICLISVQSFLLLHGSLTLNQLLVAGSLHVMSVS